MKKKFIVLLIAATLVMAGAAGFGGAYMANRIINGQLQQVDYGDAASIKIAAISLDADSDADAGRDAEADSSLDSSPDSSPPEQMNIDDTSDAVSLDSIGNDYIADGALEGLATIDSFPDGYAEADSSRSETSVANEIAGALSFLNLSGTANAKANEPLSIPEIASLASGSIVEIYTESVVSSRRMGQFVTEGAGSGVIITTNGYIVTNNHVIDGSSKITVHLHDDKDKDYEAVLIGRDIKTDLAVIKIDATGLQPAIIGNSDKLVVGELAVAIGNPLGELGGTVTEGIISALSRNIDIDGNMMTLLQTSAAVNPGNSGGGLFNNYGELIGVVNAKSSGSDIEGIGFAIPANLVKSISDALIEYGYVPGRIDFGATLIDIPDARAAMMYRLQAIGVYVSQADSDSLLQSGDRIISIDGANITSEADVKALLEEHKVGDVLSVVVSRNGSNVAVSLKLKQARA